MTGAKVDALRFTVYNWLKQRGKERKETRKGEQKEKEESEKRAAKKTREKKNQLYTVATPI